MLRDSRKRGIAARMGSWSARHKKSVLAGWLVFVVLAVVIGGMVGTNKLTNADEYNGQSGAAEKTLEQHFPKPAHEEVLITSPTLKADDPAFTAAIRERRVRVAAVRWSSNDRRPAIPTARASSPRTSHSALVEVRHQGQGRHRRRPHRPRAGGHAPAQQAHPQLRIEEFGDASVGSQIDKSVGNDLKRAETLSLPVTLIILDHRLRGAGRRRRAGAAGHLGRHRHARPGRHPQPHLPDRRQHLDRDHADRHGGRRRLLALLPQARARGAGDGRDELSAVEIASATSGRAILISGFTVMVAMAGQFLTGDKSSTSFAVGTIMVVAVAMLGSLTALPAILALLGRHVDKGRIRIPFRRRRKPVRTESRVWSFVLDRVLRHPVVSAVAAVAVLLADRLAGAELQGAHTPARTTCPQPAGHHRAAPPGEGVPQRQLPAVVVVQAEDTNASRGRRGDRELDREAMQSGVAREPIDIDTQLGAHGHDRGAAAGRQRHQPRVQQGPRPAARRR